MANKEKARVVVAGAPEEGGTLTIAEDVLAEIAWMEAAATEGVVLREGGRKGKGRRPAPGDLEVQVSNQEVEFRITVGVRAGMRMPQVAATLRERIAAAVRAKTGYTLRAANVVVDRVVFEEGRAAEG